VIKNSTGRSPIFCSAVLGPFWVPNDLLGVKLEPFRNVKVQWGTYVLRRLVLRPSHVIKNSTGRSPIFGLAVLGPFWVPNDLSGVKLEPFGNVKVQWGTYVLRRLDVVPSNVFENSTGRSPIFGSAVLEPLGFQMHLLGIKLDPFKTLKVQCGTYVLSI
jgi:hypothetical protein